MEKWFRALDQRRIGGKRGWLAQVGGIHVDGDDLWIQVAAAGDPWQSLVLQVGQSTSIEQVITALEAPRRDHDVYPRVLTCGRLSDSDPN